MRKGCSFTSPPGGDRWWIAAARMSLIGLALIASPVAAQPPIPLTPTARASGALITHDRGIEFVTIGSPGNAAWDGNPGPAGSALGRGAVGYEYRIGRFEVTTQQWVEFYNAAFDRPSNDRLPHLVPPTFWGATFAQPNVPGGRRWSVPAGNEMIPVGNISWRMAAMYCNWLHNDRSSERSAFLNGAYDVSTFTYIGNIFQDQLTHHPGARFWIPTWDEWIKAAHYDPNRYGPGVGGYWSWSNATETGFLRGPPELIPPGQPGCNGAWDSPLYPGYSPFAIPLGAYPTTQSAWGLLDVAGGSSEWTENVLTGSFGVRWRTLDGSARATSTGSRVTDLLGSNGEEFPSISTYEYGLRIASSVPPPCSTALVLVACMRFLLQRRRVPCRTEFCSRS